MKKKRIPRNTPSGTDVFLRAGYFLLLILAMGFTNKNTLLLKSINPATEPDSSAGICSIDSITTASLFCFSKGTNDPSDDSFTLHVTVHFSDRPTTGTLDLTGDGTASIDVSLIDSTATSHTFQWVSMDPDGTPISLTASFSENTSCSLTNNNAGPLYDNVPIPAPNDCVRCKPGVGVATTPPCFPAESAPCNYSISYAPDPARLDHMPIKYIQVILHVFQKEDPNDPTKPHPTDPGNWTINDTLFFKSWFDNTPGNVNDLLGNLCGDTTSSSPYISDSRIRFVNNAQVGVDLFFHPDNEAWGIGWGSGCGSSPNIAQTKYSAAKGKYVDNNPNAEDAYHVFLSGGIWMDNDSAGVIGQPDSLDCFSGCTTGFTSSTRSCSDKPVALLAAGYKAWLAGNSPDSLECEPDWPGSNAAMSRSILGEFLHIISIDHNGGNFHWDSSILGDACDDTADESDNNIMDCKGGKCALTECQLGQAHYYLTSKMPGFLRFPTSGGGFSQTQNCDITSSDIVIENGDDIVWSGRRFLRSNIVVQSGGKLTIYCDVGMPENARITVETNGELIIDGARIFNTCGGSRWDGIVVEGNSSKHQYKVNNTRYQGYLQLINGAAVEGAVYGVRTYATDNPENEAGGVIVANDATFYNNIIGVSMANFQNYSYVTGKLTCDLSYFTSCRFLVDSLFPGDIADFRSMVTLRQVAGIDFRGCGFSNDYPNGSLSYAGEKKYGIIASDAEFLVTAKCLSSTYPCSEYQNSSFSGFATAIHSDKYGSIKPFRVTKTDFIDNARGIGAYKVDNIYVAECSFKIGSELPIGNNYHFAGIQLYRSTGYKIEQNTMRPSDNPIDANTKTIGVFTSWSGHEPNEIYKNTLDSLDFGNLSNGRNRNTINPALNQGLEYLCNGNSDNSYDIAVPEEVYTGIGIAGNQGSTNEEAGNSFSTMPPFSESHFLNDESTINYYYSTGGKPDSISVGTVVPIFTTFENICLSKLPTDKEGDLTGLERQQLEQDFNNSTDGIVRTYAANMLIREYMVDSAYTDLDEARTWLGNKGGLESHFAIVDSWLQQDSAAAANQAIANIQNTFNLTGEDSLEFLYFNDFKILQVNALNNDQSDDELVNLQETAIRSIADAGNYYGSVQAQNLINTVRGIEYEPGMVLPASPPQGLILPPHGGINTTNSEVILLNAAPNPARSQTVFHYSLPDDILSARITVTSLDGRTIKTFDISGPAGQVTWDMEELKNGIYLYRLLIDNKEIQTKRLVIVK